MWSCGIWLGRHDTSNEHLIGTKFGTLSARCVRRMPPDLQREKKGYLLNEMIGQPWDPKGARELEFIRHRPQTGPEPTIGRATEGRAPKTAGCYACRTGHGNHNKECQDKKKEWLENKRKEEQNAQVQNEGAASSSSSSSAPAGAEQGGAAAAAAPNTKKRKEAPEAHVEMK